MELRKNENKKYDFSKLNRGSGDNSGVSKNIFRKEFQTSNQGVPLPKGLRQ